jgi:hypothetical protein
VRETRKRRFLEGAGFQSPAHLNHVLAILTPSDERSAWPAHVLEHMEAGNV